MNTVREPLIVLDGALKVVSANRSFYQNFRVTPEGTVGHQIYELGNRQWDIQKLRELLETIQPHKQILEGFEVEHDFHDIGKRKMLLNARCPMPHWQDGRDTVDIAGNRRGYKAGVGGQGHAA